jgi:hypothetical protein
LAANLLCSKRLKAISPLWLPELFGELPFMVAEALVKISPATIAIDRPLKTSRIQHSKRGRSTTKPGTLLRKQIPI